MDNPDQPGASSKILRHLFQHIVKTVIGRDDLHGQVWSKRPVAAGNARRRDALFGHERSVRGAHEVRVALQPEAGVGCAYNAEVMGFDVALQEESHVESDIAVFGSCW